MSNKYWKIEDPNFDNYEQSIFINGLLEHVHSLPGVECDICDDAWSNNRVLTVGCPDELKNLNELNNKWPIPVKDHEQLRSKIEQILKKNNSDIKLFPGDSFQPATLWFISKPRYSFYWYSPGKMIISSEVYQLFTENNISGISFGKVNIEAVGMFEPDDTIPSSVDLYKPNDIFKYIELDDKNMYGPFYEVIIHKETGHPKGIELVEECFVCGKQDFEKEKCDFSVMPQEIPNTDIMYLGTTAYIIVNNHVKELIEKANLNNISFTEMKIL